MVLKKLYNIIKSKVFQLIENYKWKKELEQLKFIINSKILSDEDINNIINEFFESDEIIGTGKNINYLFNSNGELHDINNIIDKIYEVSKDYIGINVLDNEDLNYLTSVKVINDDTIDYSILENKVLGYYRREDYVNIFSKNSVFKNLDKINKWYKVAGDFYKSSSKFIDKEIDKAINTLNEYEKQNDKDDITYKNIKFYPYLLKSVLKLHFLPSSIIIGYMRLISFITNKSYDLKYTSITNEPANPIYHVSANEDLGDILLPRHDKGNPYEFLPKRISFSSNILSACIGVPKYFIDSKIPNPYSERYPDLKYRDLYVYQGIQDKGKTTYLKPELVKYALANTLQYVVNEVCVSSPIKIKKLYKIRIYYKPFNNRNITIAFNEDTYVSYDILEKY